MNKKEQKKAKNLLEYLLRVIGLRSKTVKNLEDYEEVLWVSEIPEVPECFTFLNSDNIEADANIWIDVKYKNEPELPPIPSICKGWVDERELKKEDPDPPKLFQKRLKKIYKITKYEKDSSKRYELLDDFPDVKNKWEKYVNNEWKQWNAKYRTWASIHRAYSKLYSIYQKQLRLGEEYELVLGIGLLVWKKSNSTLIKRHTIVVDAFLEFEPKLGKITVKANPNGMNPRIETDMINVYKQLENTVKRLKKKVEELEGSSISAEAIKDIMKIIVHSINSEGEYKDIISEKDFTPLNKPVIIYAPALILRKRSSRPLIDFLTEMENQIPKGNDITEAFSDLIEARKPGVERTKSFENTDKSYPPEEILFPKPYNKEQLAIAEKISNNYGVVVQGPPGTGKSHTIANLISHLLATGNRILITAKTPRALQVLKGLIPKEISPLCITVLGGGREERNSLEFSINGMLQKKQEWNGIDSNKKIEKLKEDIKKLREQRAELKRKLVNAREIETKSFSIANGKYRGTIAKIVKRVYSENKKYSWFRDKPDVDSDFPFDESEIKKILDDFRFFDYDKVKELKKFWPHFPSIEDVVSSFEKRSACIKDINHYSEKPTVKEFTEILSASKRDLAIELKNLLPEYRAKFSKLALSGPEWVTDAIKEIIYGRESVWQNIMSITQDSISVLEKNAEIADDTEVKLPEGANIKNVYSDASKLRDHLKNGGKLGFLFIKPQIVKRNAYLFKDVKIGGHFLRNQEDFSLLCNVLNAKIAVENVKRVWGVKIKNDLPNYISVTLSEIRTQYNYLLEIFSMKKLIDSYRESIFVYFRKANEPNWIDLDDVERFINSCDLALAHQNLAFYEREIKKYKEFILSSVRYKSNVHPVVDDLKKAFEDYDVEKLETSYGKIITLNSLKERLKKHKERVKKIEKFLPSLVNDMKATYTDSAWDVHLNNIRGAWQWAQANRWIMENISNKNDITAISARIKQIDEDINDKISELASLYAWSHYFSKLTENHKRHMEAWRQAMRRVGKGTGKYAAQHMREAKMHLEKCREVIPAWIMPLYKVWETVSPKPGMFDVVIVDEASQCGLEALPLFYIGKKILIVGDDRQISPEIGFVNEQDVINLTERYLKDFEYRDSFYRDKSLFAQGILRFDSGKIVLREHFRCMPEIIRFSNEFFYKDTPLIPLRQYGPDRLKPLEHVFVKTGHREGKGGSVINEPEADAIVDKIAELCSDKRYSGKSMGVIILQGKYQADLIQQKLLDRIGVEEIEKRKLICGNPYSFQGDERDIIFLSMVAAPNARMSPFVKRADEQRFNVAASRARDQMWLFHSVKLEDLSERDLRWKLLNFFINTKPVEIAGIRKDILEKKAYSENRSIVKPPKPFESWFEVDVALELLRRGYFVIPQFEVAGKRIDLVVDGGKSRLAVECDGEQWHGLDRFQEDLDRQMQLERCGWEFFRVRESLFYANKEKALEKLWKKLEERGIYPGIYSEASGGNSNNNGHLYENDFSSSSSNATESIDIQEPPKVEQDIRDWQEQEDSFDESVGVNDVVKYIYMEHPDQEYQVTIIKGESNPKMGLINVNTPMAKGLLGARVGETIDVHLPVGTKKIKILEIIKGDKE